MAQPPSEKKDGNGAIVSPSDRLLSTSKTI